MEMVKAKLTLAAALLLILSSCNPGPQWRKHYIDGRFTGVTAVAGENYEASLGSVDSVYHAPNGRIFSCGSTPAVAKLLIDAQPQMQYLKEVLAHSPEEMRTGRIETALGDWSVDALAKGVEARLNRHVDVAILNIGGIRVSMPKGDVLLDDIVSMFPFKNYLSYVTVKGSDIRYMFDFMASRRRPEAVSGARFVINGRQAEDITVGGEPLDDDKLYGVGTIDFLLDGGDSLYVARNAKELLISDCLMREWMVDYVRNLGEKGIEVNAKTDGRVTIK